MRVGNEPRSVIDAVGHAEIPVGHSFWTWWFLLPLGLGNAFCAAAGFCGPGRAFQMMLAAGAGMLVLALTAGIYLLLSRKWLTITARGFILRDFWGSREFLDNQIQTLSDSRSVRFASGQPLGELREISLKLADTGEPRVLRLRRYLGLSEVDVLDVLLERLKCRLHMAALRELKRQAPIGGRDWTWSGGELIVRAGRNSVQLHTSRLSGVDVQSGRLRLWAVGEALSVASLPVRGESVWLLTELLEDQIRQEGVHHGENSNVPVHPLGRILSERRPAAATAWALISLGLFAGLVAVICCVVAVKQRTILPAILGLSIGAPSAMVFLLGRRMRTAVFRIGELGIEKHGVSGRQLLSYEQIEMLVFDVRRQHSYGRYVGTLYTLTFASRQGTNGGIVHCEATPQEDEVLIDLCERVAKLISERMARLFMSNGAVRWTAEIVLTGEGIDFRPVALYGWRRRQAFVPFPDVLFYEVQGEWFHLWTIRDELAVIKVPVSSPNFYPGLQLLEQLCPLREDGTGVDLQRVRELTLGIPRETSQKSTFDPALGFLQDVTR